VVERSEHHRKRFPYLDPEGITVGRAAIPFTCVPVVFAALDHRLMAAIPPGSSP